MEKDKYITYVNENIDNIAAYVNECFNKQKPFIKAKIIRELKKYINPLPIHYEWENGYEDNPYDHSGILVEKGIVSTNQTVAEFLENEYTGNRIASYESGCGWYYDTYGEDLSYDTIDIAGDIMRTAIRTCIENEFSVALNDDEFMEISDECGNFDDIYGVCIASDFFIAMPAIEFIGIENVKISRFVEKSKYKP